MYCSSYLIRTSCINYFHILTFRQDTSRVFSDIEDTSKHGTTSYGSHFVRHNIPPTPQRAVSPTRKNKPQPTAVTFLRQNPRFVCEPICHVDTLIPKDDTLCSWWPNEIKDHAIIKPKYTYHSTSRADYKNFSLESPRGTSYSRHEILNQRAPKPEGNIQILPGCSSPQVMPNMLEKISYEHQFNSRRDPSFPVRGRRHGCFVWKASLPVYRTDNHKYLKSKSPRNKKYANNELNITETIDNSDTKSIISTISEKPKIQETSSSDNDKILETFEHKVKSNAWSSDDPSNNQSSMVTKQQTQTKNDIIDFTEDEMEDVIRPSKPRRHASPPHIV